MAKLQNAQSNFEQETSFSHAEKNLSLLFAHMCSCADPHASVHVKPMRMNLSFASMAAVLHL